MPRRAKVRLMKCRACGCSDLRSCDDGCEWASVEARSAPLCSSCSGTEKDLVEVLSRIGRLPRIEKGGQDVVIEAARIARAAVARKRNLDASNQDPSWGGR